MSGENFSKYWTSGMLKSRGWTEDLMRELLPKPKQRYYHDRRVRMWETEVVMAAEKTAVFAAGTGSPEGRTPRDRDRTDGRDRGAAVERAMELIAGAWAGADRDESEAWRLAFRYHEALEKRLKASGWAEGLRPGKITGYLEQFLNLERAGSGEKLANCLRRFSMALPWAGKNEENGLVRRVLERYAAVLRSVAERELKILLESSPSADLEGFLSMERFPSEELLRHAPGYIYSVYYVPQAIRKLLYQHFH